MKSISTRRRLVCVAAFLSLVAWASQVNAQWAVGTTWLRTTGVVSADGKTMTVEDVTQGAGTKTVETWVRK